MAHPLIVNAVTPLGISPELYVYHVENDKIFSALHDSKEILGVDFIYKKLVEWFEIEFPPVAIVDNIGRNMYLNKEEYLVPLLYLITSRLRMNFVRFGIEVYDTKYVLYAFFEEVKVKRDLPQGLKDKIDSFYKTVW